MWLALKDMRAGLYWGAHIHIWLPNKVFLRDIGLPSSDSFEPVSVQFRHKHIWIKEVVEQKLARRKKNDKFNFLSEDISFTSE